MDVLFWAILSAFAVLVPLAGLLALLWVIDKLMVFLEPARKALLTVTPLGVSLGVAIWALTDPCMPPALRGFFLFLMVIAIPISAWFARGILTQGEDWERAAKTCREESQKSIEGWRKRLPGSKTS